MIQQLTLEWLNSESQIPQALWDNCFPAPYEGQWWYRSLECSHLEKQFTFTYGLISYNGEPVGIAPAFVMDVPIELVMPPIVLPVIKLIGKFIPSFLYQRTFFIGSACSDEGHIGIDPQFLKNNEITQDDVFICIQEAAEKQAKKYNTSMLVWKDFPEAFHQTLSKISKSKNLFPLVSFPSALLKLKGNTTEDYFESLKTSRRYQLKKKLKKGLSAPLEVSVIHLPDNQTLHQLYRLFSKTYLKGKTKFEELTPEFFEFISREKEAHFIILRHQSSNEIIAFMLCFHLDDHVINKFIGIDYEAPRDWFIYFRLWIEFVNWSYKIGAKTIQSGQTAYPAKIETGHQLIPLTNFCKHRNILIHKIYRKIAGFVNWDTLDHDLAIYLKAYPEEKPNLDSLREEKTMMWILFKLLMTSGMVVLISEIAKKSDRLGGLIAALPLVTVLTLIWLYVEKQPESKIANHAWYTFWYVVPTLPMFLAFPFLLKRFGFWPTLGISVVITLIVFYIFAKIVKPYGVELL